MNKLKKPFVLASWGMSLDGKIATKTGDSKYISNGDSLQYIHEVRNSCDGILVGINTVLKDNPKLTTRLKHKECRHPHRFILDSQLRIPLEAKVVQLAQERVGRTTVITTMNDTLKRNKLQENNVDTIQVQGARPDLEEVLHQIYQIGIESLLVEGGSTIFGALYDRRLIDKVICTISPKIIGGNEAISPIGGTGPANLSECLQLKNSKSFVLGDDVIFEGELKKN